MRVLLFILFFQSLSATPLEELEGVLFPKSQKVRTDMVLIWKDGKVLYEKYARGYSKQTRHLSWSMAKTFTSILIGIAADKGFLSLEDKVQKYFPKFQGDATINDVLQMSSGIKFKERYAGIPTNEDVTKMLYLDGVKTGFANYVVSLPLRKEKPGEHFYYSSGDSNLLMAILKKALPKEEDYNQWPWKVLFDPLEMDITFEQDSTGVFVGSSYIYAKSGDYLKVAKLLVDEGKYQGKQILSTEYVKKMFEVAPGVLRTAAKGTFPNRAYSMHAFLNHPIPSRGYSYRFPHLPSDTLMFSGYQGQVIAVSPSQKLIIIRLGMDRGRSLSKKNLFEKSYQYVKSLGVNIVSAFDRQDYKPSTAKNKMKSILTLGNLHKAPALLQAYAAKEICSCHFVLGRSLDQCRDDMKNGLPFIPRIRVGKDSIKSSILFSWWPTKAIYRGKKLGCYLPASS